MNWDEKIRILQKKTLKEIKNKDGYEEMKNAFLILEKAGVTNQPKYNLQTVENMGYTIPTFANIIKE